jgi:hypothetical protein
VARTWDLPIARPDGSLLSPAYVTSPGHFSDTAFRTLDKAVQLASEHGIRLIVTLTNNSTYSGGIAAYAAWRNQPTSAFYTNSQLISDFEATISYVLNRTNYYTGIQYKNDPAILGWETGNELYPPDSWTSTVAAYIKGIDSNHLVIDGKRGISSASLSNPDVDVVSQHYYPYNSSTGDIVGLLQADRPLTVGKRPLLAGEFGLASTSMLSDFMDEVETDGTAGALIWSLCGHKDSGGFYWHSVINSSYKCYHYPGFSSGDSYDETNALESVRAHAYAIRGLSVPAVSAPSAPTLLSFSSTPYFSWIGSAGASGYVIQRATSATGPWTTLESNYSDANNGYRTLYSDYHATIGATYYYRVAATNTGGTSPYSNVVGPVTITSLDFVDDLNDLSRTSSHTTDLNIRSTNPSSVIEDTGRLARTTDTTQSVTYQFTADASKAYVQYFSKGTATYEPLTISSSPDGTTFTDQQTTTSSDYPSFTNQYGISVWRSTTLGASLPAGTHYVRFTFSPGTGDATTPQIGRIVIRHS